MPFYANIAVTEMPHSVTEREEMKKSDLCRIKDVFIKY